LTTLRTGAIELLQNVFSYNGNSSSIILRVPNICDSRKKLREQLDIDYLYMCGGDTVTNPKSKTR
jgi:hypothetical protein